MRRSLLLCAVFAAACDASTAAPPPTAPTATVEAPAPGKEAGASPFGDAKLCGCSLCAPLPSSDACKSDDECAPSTPCHAKACVGKARAEPRKPDQMCTQDLQCDSIDANACGCVSGRCTLYPRLSEKK